jgi:hypothetical protein
VDIYRQIKNRAKKGSLALEGGRAGPDNPKKIVE